MKARTKWIAGSAILALLMVAWPIAPAGAVITCATPLADRAAHWTATLDASDAFGCHDGTLTNGAAFGLGSVGTAFSFDGTNDYVAVRDHPLWTLGSADFSISFSFNLTSSCNLCFFVGASQGGGPQNKWIIYLWNGKLTFHVNFNGAATGVEVVSGAFAPIPGIWYHVELVRAGDVFLLTADGAPVGAAVSTVTIPDPNGPLTIGQAEGLGYVHGLVDEVEVVKGV